MACMSALVTPCDHLTAPRSAAGRAGAGAGGGTPARCISAPRGWGAGDCIIHHTLHMCRTGGRGWLAVIAGNYSEYLTFINLG